MKIVTKKARTKVAKYFCDIHPNVQCYNEIKTSSWYGSIFDTTETKAHLCDECFKKIKTILEKKFRATTEDILL